MNKAELIEKISKDANISKVQANAAIDSFTSAIVETLKRDERVTLVGFGTFSVLNRAARNGRNPKSNTSIHIDARKVPKFKPGKDFAAQIGENKI
jgi:DNA-binding protein HU-beta